MKIINEKGKLFGIINVVDLLVIIIVVGVVAGVVWKLGGSKVKEALSENMEITYTVLVSDVDESFYEETLKNIPSQLMTSGELLNGQVVSVEKSQSMVAGVNSQGETVYSPDEGKIDMLFTVTSIVSKSAVDMKVGTQEIRTGKDIILKTRYFEYIGTVMSCDVPS